MPDVLPGEKFVVGSAVGNITLQASQILGFVAGAAVVAILDPHKRWPSTPRRSACRPSSSASASRARLAPGRTGTGRASLWSTSADGIRIAFGSRLLLILLLFG